MVSFQVAELFAGIGGVNGGLIDAGGYIPVALIDTDPVAAKAFRANFPAFADRYHVRSVRGALTGEVLLELAGGQIDGILGCPPCQGLSQAGLRDFADARNQLIYEMRRLISRIKPLFFIMENVPSLLRSPLYVDFVGTLERTYAIAAESINAAEYGVPQLRRRAVIIGFRRDLGVTPTIPAATHGGAGEVFDYVSGTMVAPGDAAGRRALDLRPLVPRSGRPTMLPNAPLVRLGEALDDLPLSPPTMQRINRRTKVVDVGGGLPYQTPAQTPYQRRMRRTSSDAVLDHQAWRHGDDLVARLRAVAPGDCPSHSGTRSRNTRYFSQAYARLHRDGLARTITTNFHNPGGGRFTHYGAPRTLTLREALRVQGFPDHFRFDDLHAVDAERLVGNAFPRLLAEALGRHVQSLLTPVL